MSIKDGKHNRNQQAATQDRWLHNLRPILVGRTIESIRYLSDSECEDLGWFRSAIALVLDDGTTIWPSADDEGNDAGALFTSNEDMPIIPVI